MAYFVKRNSTGDTWIDYSNQGTNYNGTYTLRCQWYNGSPNKSCISFIEFDLTDAPSFAGGCTLRLTAVGAYDFTHSETLYCGRAANTLNETTAIWTSSPNWIEEPYKLFTSPSYSGQTIDIDVTSIVQAALNASQTKVTFMLGGEYGFSNANYYYDFGARDSQFPPYLIFHNTPPSEFQVSRFSIADTYTLYEAKEELHYWYPYLAITGYNYSPTNMIDADSLVKFDIQNVPSYVNGVYLRLTLVAVGNTSTNPTLMVTWRTNDWSEYTVNRNTMPDLMDFDNDIRFAAPSELYSYTDIDVTSWVTSAIAQGLTEISFKIEVPGGFEYDTYYYHFGSRESGYPPQLIFQAYEGHMYVASAGCTLKDVQTKVFPFPAPDMALPPVVEGEYRRFATADLYKDTATSTVYGKDYVMTVRGGVSGAQDIYIKFPLTYITEIKTAKLRLYCIDYNTDGTYMTLRLQQRDSNFEDSTTNENLSFYAGDRYNVIYTAPDMTIGCVEIDVTSFVQIALTMQNPEVAFSISSYSSPIDRDLYATFATHEAPTQFKPHLVLQTIIPASDSRIVPASADCYASSARPIQTHGDMLHVPPILPVINHELSEYPVCCDPVETAWFYFDLSDLNDTIKTATFSFWVKADSSFLTIETYDFLIKGRYIPFDQETFSYANSNASNVNDVSVTCSILASEYSGQTKKVTVDITEITKRSMAYGGLLLSISGDTAETTKVAEILIGGRISSSYPYLTIATDEKIIKSTEHIDNADTSVGKSIVHADATYNVEYSVYTIETPIASVKETPAALLGAGSFNCHMKFDLRSFPKSVLSKLELAVLHIPVIMLDKPSTWKYYSALELDYSIHIIDEDGISYSDKYIHTVTGYHFYNIAAAPHYLQLDLTSILYNSDYYSHLYDTNGTILDITIQATGDVTGQDLGEEDHIRIGTEAGGYPPYIEFIWDDYGLDYYVNVFTGNDSNDGLSPTTPWRTWDHAMKNVPDTTTLFVTGNFTNEIPDNRISPLQNNVTVRINDTAESYNYPGYSFVEINYPGTKKIAWDAKCDYDYANSTEPDRYRFVMTKLANQESVYQYLSLFFDISQFTYPVASATLYFYIIDAYEYVSSTDSYLKISAESLAGGITPDTMTHVVYGVYPEELDLDPYSGALQHNSGYWYSVDITGMLNYILLKEDPEDNILTDDILGIKLGMREYPLIYRQTVWISTPLITSSKAPYIVVSQTADDTKRTPGR